jgi:phosphate transport system substrate-binding protein
VLEFFHWAYKNGSKDALALDYIPLPESVIQLIEKDWKEFIKDGSGKAIW